MFNFGQAYIALNRAKRRANVEIKDFNAGAFQVDNKAVQRVWRIKGFIVLSMYRASAGFIEKEKFSLSIWVQHCGAEHVI